LRKFCCSISKSFPPVVGVVFLYRRDLRVDQYGENFRETVGEGVNSDFDGAFEDTSVKGFGKSLSFRCDVFN